MTNTVRAAASTLGLQIDVVHARDGREIEFAFAGLVRNKDDAVLVVSDALFFTDVSSSSRWRRAMRFLPCMCNENMRTPGG